MERSQGMLFPLVHVGNYPERIEHNIAEAVYSREWEEKNKVEPWINHGQCLLECILSRYEGPPFDITQRDATVAASVIQWLGTNCGKAFIYECEKKIKEAERGNHIAQKLMRNS